MVLREALVGSGPALDDFADLCRDHLPRVLNYMRLRVGEEDLAQDLTAEVFERAVAKRHTLRQIDAFGAWLFAIARNTVAGHYRRKRPTVSLEQAATQGIPVLVAPDPGPPDLLVLREELSEMLGVLATLSEREQEIIRLKFGGGLGNQEIARVLRLRSGHVAVLLYRTLRKLRRRLEGPL